MRYFFHVTRASPEHDTDGIDLPNVAAAEQVATRLISNLLLDRDSDVFDQQLSVTIANQQGLTLAIIDVVGTRSLIR